MRQRASLSLRRISPSHSAHRQQCTTSGAESATTSAIANRIRPPRQLGMSLQRRSRLQQRLAATIDGRGVGASLHRSAQGRARQQPDQLSAPRANRRKEWRAQPGVHVHAAAAASGVAPAVLNALALAAGCSSSAASASAWPDAAARSESEVMLSSDDSDAKALFAWRGDGRLEHAPDNQKLDILCTIISSEVRAGKVLGFRG
ncbi:hypothetical protein TSOC_003498 [Tetrabaena socialis]|uniref:Uncharacterized protein n=1 Tax=Tetrabaena socialis TaxID=47790 RepID=A0A2J8ABF9_9CHLO|nr:hypothetical protein TSOC_003498 [Tetrabaena socialis]|eukprot:PNH09858.1 hypothetical protein TSOC_003498 [Tetrabaena socialis]